jgi:hypothetical protein
MFFALAPYLKLEKAENGPWDKQYCSGNLMPFTNTTGGEICRIFMKW